MLYALALDCLSPPTDMMIHDPATHDLAIDVTIDHSASSFRDLAFDVTIVTSATAIHDSATWEIHNQN